MAHMNEPAVTVLDPSRNRASCDACGAPNDPACCLPGTARDIHDVRMGNMVLRLCTDCLERLRTALRTYLDEPPVLRPGWRTELLAEVTGNDDPDPSPELVARLEKALMAVPDYTDYAHLVHRLSGAWPVSSRPGRRDDQGMAEDDAVPSGVRAARALAFLKDPVRAEFVRTGRSDLDTWFPDDMAKWLNDHQFHVLGDLDRLPGDWRLFDVPGITPAIARRVCAMRNRTATDKDAAT